MNTDVIVVGGGPAGMMAAVTAAEQGASVLLIERNAKVGRKLYITGKGRCNLTNDCSAREILENVPGNGRFLTSAVTRFPPQSVMERFQRWGVPLKTERGRRVFPVSDRAADVVDALFFVLRKAGVLLAEDRVSHVRVQGESLCVEAERKRYSCKAVILATGGVSYPQTGSTGDGYRIARELGHTLVEAKASLVPLVERGTDCRRMQGLSLKNISIKVKDGQGKVCFQEQGELLFTHFGLSGPLILSASAHMREFERQQYTVWIDLKPALDEQTLDARLLRDFGENPNRSFHNALNALLPKGMIPVVVERSGIAPEQKVHSITKQQRRRLLELLKAFPVEIAGTRPVEEAIVTSGGVKVSEVDPKTMASKLVPGLFFAGELLDVDAYTGGFNLQLAWSTGHAAGMAAAEACAEYQRKGAQT